MGTTTTLLTFEEFERLPDQPGKRELLDGELIELPPAELNHNQIAQTIFLRLYAALSAAHARGEAGQLGEAYHEMGYKLSGHGWVQPDISLTHAGQAAGKYLVNAPGIAIEVVSPINTAEAMETKVAIYFRHGAREVWRVYPKTRTVVVHVGATARTETETVTTPLLPGFTLNIAEILGTN